MYSRIFVVFGALLLILGSAARTARAQSTADGKSDAAAAARAQVEIAEKAYTEGRYRDAITAYLAADRLQPNPALQLSLGKCYEQLNDPSHALASYREYFTRAPRAPDRAHVQERVGVLARALAERGVQQVSVSSTPAGASVVIDGKGVGVTPIYVDLQPGQHHLEFHQAGYDSASLDFELAAEQPLNVMTTLVAARGGVEAPQLAAAAAPAAAAPEPAPEPSPASEAPAPALEKKPTAKTDEVGSMYRTIGFAALGASVAALAAATTLELMRSQSESNAKQETEQIAFKQALDTMESQQTWARVFAVSAGVLAAGGAVLLVLASERTSTETEPEGMSVACGPSACAAAYRGSF
ncbi:MAG TPA: PEGA domain-containing protein [Polyangiales bacterium]|nr:PEGA domain-containing protein [Polyangiales bacterium]